MTWVKLDDNWDWHPKVLQVSELAQWMWIKCITYAKRYNTDGFVPGVVIQKMHRHHSRLVAELVTAKLLHSDSTGVSIHDFLDWNMSREEQSEHAKRISKGMRKTTPKRLHSDSTRLPSTGNDSTHTKLELSSDDASELGKDLVQAEVQNSSGTKFSETETETSINTCQVSESQPVAVTPKTDAKSDVKQVFEHWQTVMGYPRAKLDPKREARIKARLREGFDSETLCRAIDGAARSDWHMGLDPNTGGKKYNGIETVLRDAAQVEKFLELAETTEPDEPIEYQDYQDNDPPGTEYVTTPPPEFGMMLEKLSKASKE